MAKRRGISLVELMLTLSACCVILTLSTGLIHRAMHAQSKARLFFDGERSASRLGHAFRQDVYDAKTGAKGEGDLLLRLEMPSGQAVLYRQSSGRVERTVNDGESVRARELYVFPADAQIMIANDPPRVFTLSIDPPAELPMQPDAPLPAYSFPVTMRVQAIVGRNAALIETARAAETAP
jgi:hypothetical protein